MPRRLRAVLRPAACDLLCALAFAAAGRSAHSHGTGIIGVLSTAWPFLVGTAAGWGLARAWRSPLRLWPTAAVVWAATWGVGMALRGATGGGLAASFLVVAAVVLGALLAAWRLVARLVLRAGELQQD
jgi:hypothetical protein